MHLRSSLRISFSVRRVVCGVAACAMSTGANALCISTTADLYDAMQAYSDSGASSGQNLDIRLVRNKTYKVGAATGNGAFYYHSTAATGYIAISGGWDAACSVQTPDATATILDGNNSARVVRIDNNEGGTYIENLTIQNGNSSGNGAGLSINNGVLQGGIVSVHYTIIQNNHSDMYDGGLLAWSYGSTSAVYVAISDNLILDNSADLGNGAGYVEGDAITNGLNLFNNVVHGNSTIANGGVGGLVVGGTETTNQRPYLASNIFWQNTNIGLSLFGTPAALEYNDYGTLGGTPPYSSDGNLSQEPKFVDAAGGDFHLSGQSPLIGHTPSGAFCEQASDIEGHPRAYTSPCDAGAYAETIFANGVEAN